MKSNSWMVRRKDTGEVIGEFYNEENIKCFHEDKVIIETAYDYLCRMNKEINDPAANEVQS